MLPTLSSYTLDENAMLEARQLGQDVFSQLHVNHEGYRTQQYVTTLDAACVRALFITVDAPQLGRGEKDRRNKFTQQEPDVQGDEEGGDVDRSQGATGAISNYIDPGLCWDDIPCFQKIPKMEMPLKGIQRGEDDVRAFKHGLHGCVLSNHGG